MKLPRREMLGVLTAVAGSALVPASLASAAEQATTPNGPPAEKVTGVGGFFFRARDPKALAQWYQDHLGISVLPKGPCDSPWNQQAGSTAFAPFPETTSYFGDPAKQWMMNFRVRDLDKMTKQLEAAGIASDGNTVYPLLRRLEERGLLSSEWNTDESRPRKFYRTTDAGNELATQLLTDVSDLTASLHSLNGRS